MSRSIGRPSAAPQIVEHLRGAEYGTPKTIAAAIGAHPEGIARVLKKMLREGALAQDPITRAYHLAESADGVALRLGVVRAV